MPAGGLMKNTSRTKEELLSELDALRQKLADLQINQTRPRTDNEALKSETSCRSIIETIKEGYYELDKAGNLTFFNNRVCEILGYPRDELMGMNYRRFVDDYNARKSYEAFNKVYRTGKATDLFDYEIVRNR
jgi:PAS domain-containing protein